MPLLRKDLKIGLLAGAVLLVLAVIYALVLTFSGSSELPPVAQRPAQDLAEPDGAFEEPAGEQPTDDEASSPLEAQGLMNAGQAPSGEWSAYGFNGNPPIVTETPPMGSRAPPPTEESPLETAPVNPLPQVADSDLDAADAIASVETHEVAAGETLSGIAEKYYGDANLFPLIERANPRVDSRRLKVGQKLLIPDRDSIASTAAQPASAPPARDAADPASPVDGLYEVKPGDTLARIAHTQFGREALWEEIYKLNQDVIGPDPAKLKVGMKLKMPS